MNVLSMVLMLIGVGKWKQWLYLLAFPPLPIILCLYFYLPKDTRYESKDGILIPLLLAGVLMVCINRAVAQYYFREQLTEPIQQSTPLRDQEATTHLRL